MRKGKKPKQHKRPAVGYTAPRRPTTNDIGICKGCGWRKTVTVARGGKEWPIGPMTAHMSAIQIRCPVCAKRNTR